VRRVWSHSQQAEPWVWSKEWQNRHHSPPRASRVSATLDSGRVMDSLWTGVRRGVGTPHSLRSCWGEYDSMLCKAAASCTAESPGQRMNHTAEVVTTIRAFSCPHHALSDPSRPERSFRLLPILASRGAPGVLGLRFTPRGCGAAWTG
jgi:hypothetical protein